MGSWFQTFVARDPVDGPEANALAIRVVAPLIARGVLLPERNGEHLAGPAHETIVATDGHHPRGRLRVRRGDGAMGRGVFGGGRRGGDGTRCPRCGHILRMDFGSTEHTRWGDAITDWWNGGTGALACCACGVSTAIVDWPADVPLGFGYLAFELWDFARLSDPFVAERTTAIGRRAVLVSGKI